MKKYFKYLLLFLLPLTFIACSKDDDGPKGGDGEKSLVGTWICTRDAYGNRWEEPLQFVFKSNGSGYYWFQDEPYSSRYEFVYEATSRIITFDEDGDDYDIPYEISSDGNTLTLYGFDDNDMSVLKCTRQK